MSKKLFAEVHVDFYLSVFLSIKMSINYAVSKIRTCLRAKIPSDFESDALTTRPWLLADFSILISPYFEFSVFYVCFPVNLDEQNNAQKSMLISICFLV